MLEPIELTQLRVTTPVVLSIGVFDGVHLGHQHLLGSAVARAHELNATSAALTFDPHPQAVLSPGERAAYITDLEERSALVGRLGIDLCTYLRFDEALAHMTAVDFVDLVLRHLNAVELWVGPDFALGTGRQGTIPMLAELGRQKGFRVVAIPPYILDGEVVSSTAIRSYLALGDVEKASEMLGRCYELCGPVIGGDRRGRQLGFPTANVAFDPKRAIPADGVYAAYAIATPQPPDGSSVDAEPDQGGCWASVVSIGMRPTFGGGRRGIEAHLLDFHGNLYGRSLSLRFVKRLRPELKFGSSDELVAQMMADVDSARTIFGKPHCQETLFPLSDHHLG